MKKLVKNKDVHAHVPVSRSQLYAMIAAGRFLSRFTWGGSGSFWVEDEVNAWLDMQIEANRAA